MKFTLILALCAVLMGCTTPKVEIPAPISISPTVLRCRIIIEQTGATPVIAPEQALVLFKEAEKYFIKIPLEFRVTEIIVTTIPVDVGHEILSMESLAHPDCCSIYFIDPNPTWAGEFRQVGGMIGLSTFPWDKESKGIFIFSSGQTPKILGHEIGHWLGLMHTFEDDGDGVADTSDEVSAFEYNLMNYNIGTDSDQYLTDGQINRIKFFLSGDRLSSVIK